MLFRLAQLERGLERLQDWRGAVDVQRSTQEQQMASLHDAMSALAVEVKGLRRTLTTLALSIAGSCLVFGLSVLAATGKI